MEGYLLKRVQKIKFLQVTLHPKRYFKIDNKQNHLVVKKDLNDTGPFKTIHFREFLKVIEVA